MSLTKATYSMIDGAYINVFDYGATGDGVTDDTAAIQLALDQGSGRTVYFPEGQYIVSSPLSVKTRTYVLGEQRGQLGFPTSYQNYFGDYVSGTLIKYTGENACFELIGDGTAAGNVELCQFENIALWGAPLTVTRNFSLYKPKHFNSIGFFCFYGSGHKWINCWTTSFGYGGYCIGYQGTYRGTVYDGHKSGAGRPTNCKMINCYNSNNFGYGLVLYTEQFEVEGLENDSFTINSSVYSGFQNPVSGDYETGSVFLANGINIRFQSCHFEGDSGRAYGVYQCRQVVDGASSFPAYNRYVNCNFYGNIVGLSISRTGGTDSSFNTQVVGCAFSVENNSGSGINAYAGILDGGLQTVVDACSFLSSATVLDACLDTNGTGSVISNNVFKGCNNPIKIGNNAIVIGNTTTSTTSGYSVYLTGSVAPNLIRNQFDLGPSVIALPVTAGNNIDDAKLGIQTANGPSVPRVLIVGSKSISTTGTAVAEVSTGTTGADKPFTLRLRVQAQNASGYFAEAIVYGLSNTTSAPTIRKETLIAFFGYAAVADFLDLSTTGSGTFVIKLKSGTGGTANMWFEIEMLSTVFGSINPI
jgi:hypothetical protein